ncbi:MAG: hypothetical protein ACFCUV_01685 [Rivularia sp. (in: cyanobacteria)]
MNLWILDTDTLTLYQNRNLKILQRLNQIDFVTRNLRDFSRIPNLKFEDWTL